MTNKRTKENLLKEFDIQIYFLKESISSYDRGNEIEFKRIALALRILLHDGKGRTRSLLSQLEMKNKLFLDSSFPFEETSLITHSGLVMIGLQTNGGPGKPLPVLDGPFNTQVSFDDWWNGLVFRDNNGKEFSRKDIVLTVADSDGGAHVDACLPDDYSDLTENNSLGWQDVYSSEKTSPGADQVPASIRQIAHEVLRSLEINYAVPTPVGNGMFIMGASLIAGEEISSNTVNLRADRPKIGGNKIGRNDPCFCGSKLKYKKCCINK